jgi:hypothetical protein
MFAKIMFELVLAIQVVVVVVVVVVVYRHVTVRRDVY